MKCSSLPPVGAGVAVVCLLTSTAPLHADTEIIDGFNASITEITSPDDLHLDPGSVIIAVDAFGNEDSEVNGVLFQTDRCDGCPDTEGEVENDGVTYRSISTHFIDNWSNAPFFTGGIGDSADNLSAIMEDIRWSAAPSAVTIEVEGLPAGVSLEIQLLFNEGADRNRRWDIGVVDGDPEDIDEEGLIFDDIQSEGISADSDLGEEGAWTDENSFVATFMASANAEGELTIVMQQHIGGQDPPGGDNNPILQAAIIHAAGGGGIDVVHGKEEIVDEGTPDGWDLTVVVVDPLLTSEETDAGGTADGTVTSWTAAFREDRADGDHTVAPLLVKQDTDTGEITVVGVGELITPEEGGVFTLPFALAAGSDKIDLNEPNTNWLMGIFQGGPNGNNAGAVVPFASGGEYPMFAMDTAADPLEPDDVVTSGHASPDNPAAREYQFNFTVTWGGGGDRDGDGLPNFFEEANVGCLDPDNPDDAEEDCDNDGLTNTQEFERRTDPKKADSDDDGLNDNVETNTGTWVSATDTGTNPKKQDTDKDGLADGVETNTGTLVDASNTGTNPLLEDTDGDGKKDGREIATGTDPHDPTDPPPPDPNEVVAGYWKFEGNLQDEIGDSHGELMGGDDEVPDFVDGPSDAFGGALSLDGIGEFVQINEDNEPLFDGFDEDTGEPKEQGWSITTWFKVGAFEKSWQCLVAKGEGNRWRIHRRGGESIMTGNGGNADVSAGSISVDDDEWHHLVLISKPDEGVQLYVDGELEGESGPPGLQDNDQPMMIGENPDARNRTWNGLVDDLAFICTCITEEQVLELWNDGEGKTVGEVFLGQSGGPGFQITEIVRAGNTVTITWPSRDGQSFIVEQGADLQNWEELTDGHPSGGDETSFEVNLPDPAPDEFYLRVTREE